MQSIDRRFGGDPEIPCGARAKVFWFLEPMRFAQGCWARVAV
jgi:hypothetical protein